MRLSRRELLRAVPLTAVAAGLQCRFAPAADGMIVRMREPRNLETPPDGLVPWKTPTDRFYVRSHFATPKLPDGYALVVDGHVGRPLRLTLDELRKLPAVTKPLTLECAGNGRVYLTPAVRGLQWANGAVGTAEWTGVPLGAVLEMAKVKAGAVDVVLTGADAGAITADPPTPGTIHFDRGLPLAKAKKDECLLAWDMNGERLTVSHGAPLRAVVGGWFGMASVKWLTRITVTDKPHAGYWQTMDYSYWERRGATPSLVAVAAVQPKAIIVRPALGEAVAASREVVVSGKAWAGETAVARVEFSSDGGKTWAAAKLSGETKDFCWRDWSFGWTPTAKGPAQLVARCTDAKGTTQPDKRDPDRRTYMINHLVPVEVTVK